MGKSLRYSLEVAILLAFFSGLAACGGGGGAGSGDGGGLDPGVSGGDSAGDAFRVGNEGQLIGGNFAAGKKGDVYIQNEQVRFIIEAPNEGGATFGGTSGCSVIDADRRRLVGEGGRDNLQEVFPSINIEWTFKCDSLEILEDNLEQDGLVRVRAKGRLKVHEMIPPTLVITGMKALGYNGAYPERYRNELEPFANHAQVKNMSKEVAVEYILRPNTSFLEIRTTVENEGQEAVPLPLGFWFSAPGNLELFGPQYQFINATLDYKLSGDMSTVVATCFDDTDLDCQVSYAFTTDSRAFEALDPRARNGTGIIIQDLALIVAGQSVFKLGNNQPGVIPVCNFVTCSDPVQKDSGLYAALPPGPFTYTSYLSVGNGDVGSALSGLYRAVGVSMVPISGQVVDPNGKPVSGARVAFIDKVLATTSTLIESDASGLFSGFVPSGESRFAEKYGSGEYNIEVYKEGYLEAGTTLSGTCDPAVLDVRESDGEANMICVVGESGEVILGDIVDSDTGSDLPAMVYIAGFDDSPKTLNYGDGDILDNGDTTTLYSRPYGLVDALTYFPTDRSYYGVHHHPEGRVLRLEPGKYLFVYARGSEYEMEVKKVSIEAGKRIALGDVALQRVVGSPGYLAIDFHVHTQKSVDVLFPTERVLMNAAGVGIDIPVLTNHEYIQCGYDETDALQLADWITPWCGEEVTPLALGHFLGINMTPDKERVDDQGAVPYVKDSRDPDGEGRDYNLPVEEMFAEIRKHPGEQLILVGHILDTVLGYMAKTGYVTAFDLEAHPFESYISPVNFRLADPMSSASPYEPDQTEAFALSYDGVEIANSYYKKVVDHLLVSALPTVFNLLNLGKRVVMTSDSDVHNPLQEPLGSIRNYCRSDVDPADSGGGRYNTTLRDSAMIDSIVTNVKRGQCMITNGPYLSVFLADGDDSVSFGDTLELNQAGSATLSITVDAPKWVEWNRVRVYQNTVPEAVFEEGETEMDFHLAGTHYDMTPVAEYSVEDGTLSVEVDPETGVRHSEIAANFNVSEDAWFVVMVSGEEGETNPVFPLNSRELDARANKKESFVDNLYRRFTKGDVVIPGGVSAFAVGNPIYVSVGTDDCDKNGDPWDPIICTKYGLPSAADYTAELGLPQSK